MEFTYSIDTNGSSTTINLSGNLIDNVQSANLLSEVENLINNDKKKLIVNLAQMQYMNSCGLNTLIAILTKTRKEGGETVVANVAEKIKQLLVITKLNTVFTITDSVEEAKTIISNL